MSLKRTKITILHEIMQFVLDKAGKAKPTHIMYKTNLSSEMLNDHLTELLKKEFITEHKDKDGRKTYELTDKGCNFIKDYKQMKDFLQSYDLN